MRVCGRLIMFRRRYSLSGDYGYDAERNRSIEVGSRVLLEALRKVYHFDRVVVEIEAGSKEYENSWSKVLANRDYRFAFLSGAGKD
jgi:hypothetical protein